MKTIKGIRDLESFDKRRFDPNVKYTMKNRRITRNSG
jgi:hypothetical protein